MPRPPCSGCSLPRASRVSTWVLSLVFTHWAIVLFEPYSSNILIAQLAYNNKRLDIIKLILFFANFGKNINLFLYPREGLNTEKALVKITEIKELYSEI